jgi:hypothetical protein
LEARRFNTLADETVGCPSHRACNENGQLDASRIRRSRTGRHSVKNPGCGAYVETPRPARNEVIEPNLAPATFDNYERFVRRYIRPGVVTNCSTAFKPGMCRPGSTPWRVPARAALG